MLIGGILQAFAGMTVDDYAAAAHRFLHEGRHPTLGRRFRECGYVAGAEQALDEARTQGWTVVSVRHDWATVFDPAS